MVEVIHEGKPVTDELLAQWAADPGLRRLRLAESNMDDEGLVVLSKSPSIELLDLTRCVGVTSAGVNAIGQMTGLKNLKLSGPSIDDDSVRSLANLNNLAALSLQQTAVTDQGFKSLAPLKKLTELTLYGTPVTDDSLNIIAAFPALQKLRLRGTKVTGSGIGDAFAKMVLVVDLDLSETAFSNDGLASIGKMKNLRSLNLWLTQVDDDGVALLVEQTKLTLLNLDNVSGVTDRSLPLIATMQDLELLHLGGTSITAKGIENLYGLKSLKTLFITRLGLTQDDVAKVKAAMPWITKLES